MLEVTIVHGIASSPAKAEIGPKKLIKACKARLKQFEGFVPSSPVRFSIHNWAHLTDLPGDLDVEMLVDPVVYFSGHQFQSDFFVRSLGVPSQMQKKRLFICHSLGSCLFMDALDLFWPTLKEILPRTGLITLGSPLGNTQAQAILDLPFLRSATNLQKRIRNDMQHHFFEWNNFYAKGDVVAEGPQGRSEIGLLERLPAFRSLGCKTFVLPNHGGALEAHDIWEHLIVVDTVCQQVMRLSH